MAVKFPLAAGMSIAIALATVAGAQIDPAEGRAISSELAVAASRYRVVVDRWNALNPPRAVIIKGKLHRVPDRPRKFDFTFDGRLVQDHLNECHRMDALIDQNIHDLDYEQARRELYEMKKHIAAAEIILSESEDVPIRTVQSESKTDEQTAPVENLPSDLSGRQVRAQIASELSFAERATEKAKVNVIGFVVRENRQGGTDACGLANDDFIRMTTETARSLGVGDRYRYLEPQNYFTFADTELSFLNYDAAHRMAYVAYQQAQKVLSQCKSNE